MRPFLLSSVLVTTTAAFAGETAIATGALPQPIQATVAASYPGATVVSASTEVEEGATTYEVGIKLGGRSLDLAFSADGTQLEEEEEVPAASLPAPVRATVATFPGWTVKAAERATGGGVTTYEVDLVQGKKRMELAIGADGVVQNKEQPSDDEDQ